MLNKYILIFLLLIPINCFSVSLAEFNKIHKETVDEYNNLPKSNVKWDIIGKSRWRQPIYFKKFGNGKRSILIVGAIHGDEPSSGTAVVRLAQALNKMEEPKISVILIPFLNPDGLYLKRRTNAKRVDINRNFPSHTWKIKPRRIYNYPGKGPASEPETRVVMKAIEKYKPTLVIQVHQPFNALYPDKDVPEDLIEEMSILSGIEIRHNIGYETPGSMGSYTSFLKEKRGMITCELGRIDEIPDYRGITESFIYAIKYLEKMK